MKLKLKSSYQSIGGFISCDGLTAVMGKLQFSASFTFSFTVFIVIISSDKLIFTNLQTFKNSVKQIAKLKTVPLFAKSEIRGIVQKKKLSH